MRENGNNYTQDLAVINNKLIKEYTAGVNPISNKLVKKRAVSYTSPAKQESLEDKIGQAVQAYLGDDLIKFAHILKQRTHEKRQEDSEETNHFENIRTVLTIDINENRSDAFITFKRTVKVLTVGEKYVFSFAPFRNYSNIKSNISTTTIENIADVAQIEVLIAEIPETRIVQITLTAEVVGLFVGDTNWWTMTKNYPGDESFQVNVILPRNSEANSHFGETTGARGMGLKKNIKHPSDIVKVGERYTILFNTEPGEVSLYQELRLTWSYAN